MHPFPITPTNPRLAAWLQADGSLTSRLRVYGHIEVVVLAQGSSRLWQQEQFDLQCPSGHVREVMLLLDGRPAVWARSATSHRAITGAWRALRGLGNRPLAELLFSGSRVCRSPLLPHHLIRTSAEEKHMRTQWTRLPGEQHSMPAPRWARSSVFWRHGQPLRVMEAFAPWVATLKVV
jgi:chorismate--pyruvate lyase